MVPMALARKVPTEYIYIERVSKRVDEVFRQGNCITENIYAYEEIMCIHIPHIN